MDRELRLSTIIRAVKENNEVIEQSEYGVKLALGNKEYQHAKKCIDKILACESVNVSLNDEIRQLQDEIEAEKLEAIT